MAGDTGQTASVSTRVQFTRPHPVDTATANLRCSTAFVTGLARDGVRQLVVSSGSRCSPLVVAAWMHGGFEIHAHLDERSAGFVALGISKTLRRPAALICTSGTAAANYYPAIIEAAKSHTPLIVVTADRPRYLRNKGAPQTIDQVDLYGKYVLDCDDLPLPSVNGTDWIDQWLDAARSAVKISLRDRGPVHVNAAFDEPLLPDPEAAREVSRDAIEYAGRRRFPEDEHSQPAQPDDVWAELAEVLASSKRPLLIWGPQNDGEQSMADLAVHALSSGIPVIADVASQVRRTPGVITHQELYLRDQDIAGMLGADTIIRLGGLPTSRVLNEWIAGSPAEIKYGIAFTDVPDPHASLTRVLNSDLEDAVQMLAPHLRKLQPFSPQYGELWRRADTAARDVVAESTENPSELFEADIASLVCAHLTEENLLFLSSGMPIRWADFYVEARTGFPRVLANRGVNGIDGVISTAAGAARTSRRPTVCLTGDLAFIHDANGLAGLATQDIPLKIVILNNHGGGIFHFVPAAQYEFLFEPLVAMPQAVDLSLVSRAHGIPHNHCGSREQFSALLKDCLGRAGPEVIEMEFDRGQSYAQHQEIVRTVIGRVRSSLGISS